MGLGVGAGVGDTEGYGVGDGVGLGVGSKVGELVGDGVGRRSGLNDNVSTSLQPIPAVSSDSTVTSASKLGSPQSEIVAESFEQ